jgi:hypothetical protein
MLFQLLNLVFLINCAVASQEAKVIYNEAKEKILSHCELYYKGRIATRNCESISPAVASLRKVGTKDLLDLLLDEVSEKFILIYFFGYFCSSSLLVFGQVASLFPLKDSPQGNFHLIGIFENFTCFLIHSFREVRVKNSCFPSDLPANKNFGEKSSLYLTNIFDKFKDFLFCRPFKAIPKENRFECCSNSFSPLENYEILGKFEALWKHKIEYLARRLLPEKEFVKISNRIKELITFLDTFCKYDLEFLIIREYNRWWEDFGASGVEDVSAYSNFRFLVHHMVNHLKEVDSEHFLERFEWFSLQTPPFIIRFFYTYRSKYIIKFPNLKDIENLAKSHIVWRDGYLELFGRKVPTCRNFDKINQLAYIIVEKVDSYAGTPR